MITKLRSQYLELAQREIRLGGAVWSRAPCGDQSAQSDARNTELIRNELQRIAETYKSDLEISQQREDSVQKQLNQAVSQSQVTNKAQVSLRELEPTPKHIRRCTTIFFSATWSPCSNSRFRLPMLGLSLLPRAH